MLEPAFFCPGAEADITIDRLPFALSPPEVLRLFDFNLNLPLLTRGADSTAIVNLDDLNYAAKGVKAANGVAVCVGGRTDHQAVLEHKSISSMR